MALLEKPTSGEVFYDGVDLASLSNKAREDFRSFSIGFVYQKFNLLPKETALYNVELPLLLRGDGESKRQAVSLFKAFGLTPLMKKKAGVLSGGEKQRVALMRALAGNPKVLFADEPTGALDEKNGIIVLETLKKIAETHLVIMVTHNEKLAHKYGERLIVMEEGAIISDSAHGAFFTEKKKKGRRPHRHGGRSYIFHLLVSHLKEDKWRNLLSLTASFIGFLSFLLSFGFRYGCSKIVEESQGQSLLYYQASLMEKTSYSIEGSPLSLTKANRPAAKNVAELIGVYPSVSYGSDYSYFFPNNGAFLLDDEAQEPVSFAPLFNESLEGMGKELLIKGYPLEDGSFSQCLVNEEFLRKYGDDALHKTISREIEGEVKDLSVKDVFSFSSSFSIMGVVKEFPFLNSPRVYYSYWGLKEMLNEIPLPSISASLSRVVTPVSLVDYSSGEEAYSSYSYHLFATGEEGGESLQKLYQKLEKEETSLAMSSLSRESQAAFNSLSSALSVSLLPFLLLEGLGVVFIIGALSYSSFLERKKEAAILLSLGGKKTSLSAIYIYEASLVALLSMGLALLMAPGASSLMNSYLSHKTFLTSIILIPFQEAFFGIGNLLIYVSLLVAFVLGFLGSALPFLSLRNNRLNRELADE